VRRKKGEEEAAGKSGADEEGGKGQEKEGGRHQGGEEGGEARVGITADKDIPPITSAKGVITIDNDL